MIFYTDKTDTVNLDNSIPEEFLPILCKKLFGKKLLNYNIGPNKTLSNFCTSIKKKIL